MEEPHIENMNGKRENAINKLQEVLSFLQNAEITGDESLDSIDKPLDDLLSSLKYIPSQPSFNKLPTEIKTDILNYLCDAGALVASSVCKEWSDIVKRRFENIRKVTVGKHCTNVYKCEDSKCFMPSQMLAALGHLQVDVPVHVCHPLTDVDSSLIVEGLSGVSSLSLAGRCPECAVWGNPLLTNGQFKLLFDALEKKESMEYVEIRSVDLTHLDQNLLVNFLVNKTKSLTLDKGRYGRLLDVRKLVGQLKNSTDLKLIELDLFHLDYPDDLSADMADALCKVESVRLWEEFHLKREMAEKLQENLLRRSVVIKKIVIFENLNWRICPECVKLLLNKMIRVLLYGKFTAAQQEAAKSCPGVEASRYRISK